MDDLDKLATALKYPDYHTWRPKDKIRNGRWPDGSIVYVSDPEFKPDIDNLRNKLITDEEYRNIFLKNIKNSD